MTVVGSNEVAERFERAERRVRQSQVLSLALFVAALIAGAVLALLSLEAKQELVTLQREHNALVQQNADIRSANTELLRTQSDLQRSVENLKKQKQRLEETSGALAEIQNEQILGPAATETPEGDSLTEKAVADLAGANLHADLRRPKDEGTVVVLGSFREISNARNTFEQFRASLFPDASVRLAKNGYYAVVTDAAVSPGTTLTRAKTTVPDAYLYKKRYLPIEIRF